jgi:hypothetical protein
LAILESQPLGTLGDLYRWRSLRAWVVENDLIQEYRDQHYFMCTTEITKQEHMYSIFLSSMGEFFAAVGRNKKLTELESVLV